MGGMEKSPEISERATESFLPVESQNNFTTEIDIHNDENDTLQKNNTSSDAPDLDDNNLDDLDDLDDMLDEFIPAKPQIKDSSLPERNHSQLQIQGNLPKNEDETNFEKQLEAELSQFFTNRESSSEMVQEFETAMKELLGAAVPEKVVPKSETSPSAQNKKAKTGSATVPGTDESFQETIKKTMERMAASGEQATAAASGETDSLLAEMLKAMQSSNLDTEGGGDGEEDFSKVLLGMMEQLTNKEILYDPMKELNDKFPAWMEKNADKVEESDLKRYQEQQICVREIVQRFESKSYSDESVADKEYIVDRMQKMQAAGSPPADLVGDMAAAQEAFGSSEESCPTQ